MTQADDGEAALFERYSQFRSQLAELKKLECRRPDVSKALTDFSTVRCYREGVNRHLLSCVELLASPKIQPVGPGDMSWCATMGALFQIVMLFQIADDVLDVSADRRLKLASLVNGVRWDVDDVPGLTLEYCGRQRSGGPVPLCFRIAQLSVGKMTGCLFWLRRRSLQRLLSAGKGAQQVKASIGVRKASIGVRNH